MYYYIINIQLLHHYHVIITSLFHIGVTGNYELIITFFSIFDIFIITLLLPIITIITHTKWATCTSLFQCTYPSRLLLYSPDYVMDFS